MPATRNPLRFALAKSSRLAHFAEFLFRRSDASRDIYPDDPAHGTVNGSSPRRVVFLGEPGEISLGVRTHEISLPAFFSRRFAAITARGVTWSICPLPNSQLDEAPKAIAGIADDLPSTDLVVIMVGICDTLRVISAGAWERQLRDMLDALMRSLPDSARIVIADIPPLDNAGSLSRAARVAAGAHGSLLNRQTRVVAREYDAVTVMEFPVELTNSLWLPEGIEERYSHTYRVWGAQLAETAADVTPVL